MVMKLSVTELNVIVPGTAGNVAVDAIIVALLTLFPTARVWMR